ncbi:hypothetical protein GXW75_25460, partial [Roseomonas oryzicola]|nr:hypothetical protein [Neoroseomonas oryzicola]
MTKALRRGTAAALLALGAAQSPALAQGLVERLWDDVTGRQPAQPAPAPAPAPRGAP